MQCHRWIVKGELSFESDLLGFYLPSLYELTGSIKSAVGLCAYKYYCDRLKGQFYGYKFSEWLSMSQPTGSRLVRSLQKKGFINEDGSLSPEVLKRINNKRQVQIPIYHSELEKLGGWNGVTCAVTLQQIRYLNAKNQNQGVCVLEVCESCKGPTCTPFYVAFAKLVEMGFIYKSKRYIGRECVYLPIEIDENDVEFTVLNHQPVVKKQPDSNLVIKGIEKVETINLPVPLYREDEEEEEERLEFIPAPRMIPVVKPRLQLNANYSNKDETVVLKKNNSVPNEADRESIFLLKVYEMLSKVFCREEPHYLRRASAEFFRVVQPYLENSQGINVLDYLEERLIQNQNRFKPLTCPMTAAGFFASDFVKLMNGETLAHPDANYKIEKIPDPPDVIAVKCTTIYSDLPEYSKEIGLTFELSKGRYDRFRHNMKVCRQSMDRVKKGIAKVKEEKKLKEQMRKEEERRESRTQFINQHLEKNTSHERLEFVACSQDQMNELYGAGLEVKDTIKQVKSALAEYLFCQDAEEELENLLKNKKTRQECIDQAVREFGGNEIMGRHTGKSRFLAQEEREEELQEAIDNKDDADQALANAYQELKAISFDFKGLIHGVWPAEFFEGHPEYRFTTRPPGYFYALGVEVFNEIKRVALDLQEHGVYVDPEIINIV